MVPARTRDDVTPTFSRAGSAAEYLGEPRLFAKRRQIIVCAGKLGHKCR